MKIKRKPRQSKFKKNLERIKVKKVEWEMKPVRPNLGLAIRHSGVLISMSSADDCISKCNRQYFSFFLKQRQNWINFAPFFGNKFEFHVLQDQPAQPCATLDWGDSINDVLHYSLDILILFSALKRDMSMCVGGKGGGAEGWYWMRWRLQFVHNSPCTGRGIHQWHLLESWDRCWNKQWMGGRRGCGA